MAKILIAGALDFSKAEALSFVKLLGEEVVSQGHVLLTGCRNDFDRLVAEGADSAARQHAFDPAERIVSYAVAGAEPAHSYGTVLRSRLLTWGLEYENLHVPEPVHEADAVVIVGGKEGTLCAANWARIDRKPLLPITAFGGAALAAYNEEIKDFSEKYGDRLERSQYEGLNQVGKNLPRVAKTAIGLAARIQAPRHVFVIMPFSSDPRLQDAYESFREVCEEFEFECSRVDETNVQDRIVPQIFEGIRRSAFVIVDVTEQKPNVYYEFGLAQGLGKPFVVTAFKGTALPFDVHDVPTLFWESQKQLKELLRQKIKTLATLHGRA